MTKRTSIKFTLNHSTHSLYEISEKSFYGPYAHIRRDLDYNYHKNYSKERQWLQDSIIDKLLNEIVSGEQTDDSEIRSDDKIQSDPRELLCSMPINPWLVYVAGTSGSRRSTTIKYLLEKTPNCSTDQCRLQLFGFVLVDSREIRQLLPEYQYYSQELGSEVAESFTRKEVGYISEVVTRAALQAGSNVLLYGALRDSKWYNVYFQSLKNDFSHLKIAILQIVAPHDDFEDRSHRVTKAIEELSANLNYFCKLQGGSNGQDIKILSEGVTWDSFRQEFMQESACVPETIPARRANIKHRGESGFIREFSANLSTEENNQTQSLTFYGQYAHLRRTLDYSYHRNYNRERQMLQDAIIEETLSRVSVVDAYSGQTCTTPTEPFLVFTAGAMGAGKSYTLRKISEKKRFPLGAFVIVDPDEIRQLFPEYSLYVAQNPEKAGEMTRKEAGFIVEILTLSALQAGKNVLVDGSLRDHEWYSNYFDRLKKEYPSLKIVILHIDAPRDAVLERAKVSIWMKLIHILHRIMAYHLITLII